MNLKKIILVPLILIISLNYSCHLYLHFFSDSYYGVLNVAGLNDVSKIYIKKEKNSSFGQLYSINKYGKKEKIKFFSKKKKYYKFYVNKIKRISKNYLILFLDHYEYTNYNDFCYPNILVDLKSYKAYSLNTKSNINYLNEVEKKRDKKLIESSIYGDIETRSFIIHNNKIYYITLTKSSKNSEETYWYEINCFNLDNKTIKTIYKTPIFNSLYTHDLCLPTYEIRNLFVDSNENIYFIYERNLNKPEYLTINYKISQNGKLQKLSEKKDFIGKLSLGKGEFYLNRSCEISFNRVTDCNKILDLPYYYSSNYSIDQLYFNNMELLLSKNKLISINLNTLNYNEISHLDDYILHHFYLGNDCVYINATNINTNKYVILTLDKNLNIIEEWIDNTNNLNEEQYSFLKIK